ncbi:MAG: serpin family protein [Clostridiales bacterium]|nr:serpin family protein [Clostridiales bacterium]
MRKITVLMLIFLLMFSLISCGADQPEEQGAEQETTGGETVETGDQEMVTTNLMDASWQKTASEDEIDQYFDTLYSSENPSEQIRKTAMELYLKLAAEDIKAGKNTMVSPLSFLTAMGLLENGAKDTTLDEIQDAFGMDIETFNKWYDAWSKLIILNSGDALKVANSVWYKADPLLNVSEDYLKKMAEIYDAQAFKAPFTDETVKDINGWVSEHTNGMIPSIIDDISKDGVMFLINATCFEGAWFNEYEDDQIHENETFTREDGTEEKVVMLASTENDGQYYENELFTGASKMYADGFKITFMLPKEGKTLAEAMEQMAGDGLTNFLRSGQVADVDLFIPEFGFDYTAPDSIGSLKAMGIETVFDEDDADLTPMAVSEDGYNLYVNTVIHKTHVELDREGTKAAASTAIGIAKATAAYGEVPKREVRLDRPFAFVISDNQTDTPIFVGTVNSIND